MSRILGEIKIDFSLMDISIHLVALILFSYFLQRINIES